MHYSGYRSHRPWPARSMKSATMAAKEHNNTIVMLYTAIGCFYSCGIIASPWIIQTNFRKPGQVPTAIIVFGSVFLIAILFFASAICMRRKKRLGRTLALLAIPITLWAFWPVGVYSWWFLHTEAGKSLYGIHEYDGGLELLAQISRYLCSNFESSFGI
jgi:hypothetical protein